LYYSEDTGAYGAHNQSIQRFKALLANNINHLAMGLPEALNDPMRIVDRVYFAVYFLVLFVLL